MFISMIQIYTRSVHTTEQ